MKRTDDARKEILRAIRENLAQGQSSPPVLLSVPERGDVVNSPSPDLVKPFTEQLAAVGAQCTPVCGEEEAGRALARILAGARARRVVGSNAPLVQRLLRSLGHGDDGFVVESLDRLSRDELFACDAGVTTAQWGIAETGTLVLESAREKSRLLSLVPPTHVVLLSAGCICESLGDALARVSVASHAITLITGPSRTSDIELTLVVGVHGPQTLHVLLLEEA